MAYTAQCIVFISGAGINVDTNAGEMAGECFGCDADTIWEGRYLVKLNRILKQILDQSGIAEPEAYLLLCHYGGQMSATCVSDRCRARWGDAR